MVSDKFIQMFVISRYRYEIMTLFPWVQLETEPDYALSNREWNHIWNKEVSFLFIFLLFPLKAAQALFSPPKPGCELQNVRSKESGERAQWVRTIWWSEFESLNHKKVEEKRQNKIIFWSLYKYSAMHTHTHTDNNEYEVILKGINVVLINNCKQKLQVRGGHMRTILYLLLFSSQNMMRTSSRTYLPKSVPSKCKIWMGPLSFSEILICPLQSFMTVSAFFLFLLSIYSFSQAK